MRHLLICFLLVGCTTTTSLTKEKIILPDSEQEFEYSATTETPPFGKADKMIHQMVYTGAGENGGSLRVGQDAIGIDNTGQIQALQLMGEIIGTTIAVLIKQGLLTAVSSP